MYCLNCGKKIDKGLKKCPKCGEPVEKKTSKTVKKKVEEKPVKVEVKEEKNSNAVLLTLVIGILALMCVGTLCVIAVGGIRNSLGSEEPKEHISKVQNVKWNNYSLDVPSYNKCDINNDSVEIIGNNEALKIAIFNYEYTELKDDTEVFDAVIKGINNEYNEIVTSEIVTIENREYVKAVGKSTDDIYYYYYFTTNNEVNGIVGVLVKVDKEKNYDTEVENIINSLKVTGDVPNRTLLEEDASHSGKLFEDLYN